ncbi:MAG: alpha-glucosidase [Candidatus Izemoplasma sp.]|nr:alpha-glucosidase [Candidatus Izemoplasma sp.]
MTKKWWQDAIIYQLYIRSFYDANNDGIGDFKGLIDKLDYLDRLGVDAVWVSPHYQSPMDDNGYDVSDYYRVSEDYGTLDDVKTFIEKAHARDIKVIFDLVLNHTSDEHPWFQAAKDPKHPDHEKYHDYYIWQPPKYTDEGTRTMPTNWRSWFGGPVWEYNEATNEYYLHIFSKKMPDLNWRNEDMKNDLKNIIQWLIDLGVDGFRVDASNHLEKNWDFPDGHPGYEHFSSLPKHHAYLEELGIELFEPNNIFTMGEAGGATKEEALQYCGYDSHEFNVLIQFGHTWADVDWDNQKTPGKWAKGTLDVPSIKHSFNHWYDMLNDKGHNVIYWHNHDQPRIVSHYGNDTVYRERSAKMLCHTLYFMPGTAIVYQGEEIGMTNVDYDALEMFRDVEVYTEYENFMDFGASHEEAMQALRERARDNARSPFHWDDSVNAGFSQTTPWMPIVKNYPVINLQREQETEDSIWHTYKEVFSYRKTFDIAHGTITFLDIDHEDAYMYHTVTKTHDVLVVANFKEQATTVHLDIELEGYTLLLANYDIVPLAHEMRLAPYASYVYIKQR